jgi:hypothetical protein
LFKAAIYKDISTKNLISESSKIWVNLWKAVFSKDYIN